MMTTTGVGGQDGRGLYHLLLKTVTSQGIPVEDPVKHGAVVVIETVNIHIKTDENQEKVVTIFDVRNLHRIVPSVINRFLEVVLDLEHHHPLTGKLEYIRNQSVDIDPGAGRNLILEDQDQSLENVHDLDSGTDHVQDLVLIGDQNIHQMISPVLTVQRIKNQQRIQSVLMIIQISIK